MIAYCKMLNYAVGHVSFYICPLTLFSKYIRWCSQRKETRLNLWPDLVVPSFHILIRSHHRLFSLTRKVLINDDVIRRPEMLCKHILLMWELTQKIRLNLCKPEIRMYLFYGHMLFCSLISKYIFKLSKIFRKMKGNLEK